jgi:hypothetical protein
MRIDAADSTQAPAADERRHLNPAAIAWHAGMRTDLNRPW